LQQNAITVDLAFISWIGWYVNYLSEMDHKPNKETYISRLRHAIDLSEEKSTLITETFVITPEICGALCPGRYLQPCRRCSSMCP
jgi:hypothetical protein